jgi:hypothetical protein
MASGQLIVKQTVSPTLYTTSIQASPKITAATGTATPGLSATWYNAAAGSYQTIGAGTAAYSDVSDPSRVYWQDDLSSGTIPPGVNADYVNAKWTGWIYAENTATYTFSASSAERSRMWIDGKLVMVSNSSTPNGTIFLTGGNWYPIVVDFIKGNNSYALQSLSWSNPALHQQIIPLNNLSSTLPGGNIASQGSLQLQGQVAVSSTTNTATAFNVSDAGGASLFNIDSLNKRVGIGTAAPTAGLQLVSQAAATPAFTIQGYAGQTADLQQFKDTNGTLLASVDANGNYVSNGTNTTLGNLAAPAFTTAANGTSYYYVITATNAQGETVASATLGRTTNTPALAWTAVPGATGYKIYRNTSANFTSGSLLRTTITNGATVTFTDTGAATAAGLPPTAPTGTKLTLKSWQGQTANLLQALDSSGATLASISGTGDLSVKNATINGHIISANAAGSTTAAVGAGAGTGATCTISGNDTAGTVTVTTGASGVAVGTLCTVTFSANFGATPRVVLTPNNAASTTLQLYKTPAVGNFVIKTNNVPAISTGYQFDYLIVQ